MINWLFIIISIVLSFDGGDDKINSFFTSNSEIIRRTSFVKDQHWAALGRLRFSSESNSDIGLEYVDNNKISIQLYFFAYPNNEAASDALNNLLSCFPPKCEDVDWNKSSEGLYLPAIYILNDNRIYSLKIECIDVDSRWDKLVSSAIEHFSSDSSIVIHTTCNQLLWN